MVFLTRPLAVADESGRSVNSWIQNFLLTEERELEIRGPTVVLLPQGKRKR